jgi:hypothetical protein
MNNPLGDLGKSHVVGDQAKNSRTIDDENRAGKHGKKPNVHKKFLEEKEKVTPLKKNNFV